MGIESADCDRPSRDWRLPFQNKKTIFLLRCLELPDSQGCASQKHDPCYSALPRVTGEFTSLANQRHSQPDEFVELPASDDNIWLTLSLLSSLEIAQGT